MEMIYEGTKFGTPENDEWLAKMERGEEIPDNTYIEAKVVSYTPVGDLTLCFGANFGIIPNAEIEFPKKDKSKLNRYKGVVVGFYVRGRKACNTAANCWEYTLSRAAVTEQWYNEYIVKLQHGDIVDGKICHISKDSLMLIDLGYGFITALVPINASLINCRHMEDAFELGEVLKLIILAGVSDTGTQRVTVTHKELLGTFDDNATLFKQGDRVWGVVYDVKDWGTFVQLTPNTLGLTLSSDTSVEKGQPVLVEIYGIKPTHNKIQIQILGKGDDRQKVQLRKQYFGLDKDYKTMKKWAYSSKREVDMTRSM